MFVDTLEVPFNHIFMFHILSVSFFFFNENMTDEYYCLIIRQMLHCTTFVHLTDYF